MYRVLVADPPWPFGDKLPGPTRGAARNYTMLSLDEIRDFELPEMHKDSYLFLWRVASMQEEALSVMRAWGFTPKSELVWLKKTKHGKRHFGMGRTVRMEHEICLIGAKGRPSPWSRSVRSTFEGKVGRHSEKPDEFYETVELIAEGGYVELFARRQRERWTCFGDEL